MIASSSTFCTHLGRVIWALSTIPSVAWWGSCSLQVAGYNIVVDCQLGSLFHLLNSGANATPASVQALMLAVLEAKLQAIVFDIRSLMWDECYPQIL